MNKTLDITNVRQKFGTLVDEVFYKKDIITIKRKGRPLAQLVPIKDHADTQEPENENKQNRLLKKLNSLPVISMDEEPTDVLRRIRQLRAMKQNED